MFNNSRFHNPDVPLSRPLNVKIIRDIGETLLIIVIYYFFASASKSLHTLTIYSVNSQYLVDQFPLHFWLPIFFVLIISKIFHLVPSVLGALFGEIIVETLLATNYQWVLVFFIGWIAFWQGIDRYRGGEYYRAGKIGKQVILMLTQIFGFLPVLFFGFIFREPLSASERLNVRLYLVLNFFIQFLFVFIAHWFFLFFLDKLMAPYFPLTPKEKAILDDIPDSDVEKRGSQKMDLLIPQPGELYINILTHHEIEEDDHTIVIGIGKVRVYLCTRCTAMILGVLFSFFLTAVLFFNLKIPYSQEAAFIVGAILPLFAIIDWGLQSLGIRKANTVSRMITGFLLGVSMQCIMLAGDQMLYMLIVIGGYMLIVMILMFFRSKRKKSEFNEFLSEKYN
ncbi:MAG: DUF2085 domain-containing protein [Promethearchaeota archaeon]